MPMGRISVREILSRPTRALLTFTSIVIGVAAVVSVFLTTSNTRVGVFAYAVANTDTSVYVRLNPSF